MQTSRARIHKTQSNQYLCITIQIMLSAMFSIAFKFIGKSTNRLRHFTWFPEEKKLKKTTNHNVFARKEENKNTNVWQSRSNEKKLYPCEVFSMLLLLLSSSPFVC